MCLGIISGYLCKRVSKHKLSGILKIYFVKISLHSTVVASPMSLTAIDNAACLILYERDLYPIDVRH
jgi:hypothetical protein